MMSSVLIHSMSEFSDIILDAMKLAGVRDMVEIGAEYGGMSTILADHAAAQGGQLVSVDPSPKEAFVAWAAAHGSVRHIAQPSLEAIDGLSADAWVVDGDHNWYTVYHELKAIERCCRRDGRPLLVFLHDIAWPCARRDFYYAPDRIPEEYRQPYDYDGGVLLGQSQLVAHRGFRGMGQFAWALNEGGPRNGVLTAIEDFVEGVRGEGGNLAFAQIPAVFGLGILFDTDAEWSQDMAGLVIPFHESKLLAALEENRLRNYLAALDHQDRASARRRAA
jgi:hypothetical protein